MFPGGVDSFPTISPGQDRATVGPESDLFNDLAESIVAIETWGNGIGGGGGGGGVPVAFSTAGGCSGTIANNSDSLTTPGPCTATITVGASGLLRVTMNAGISAPGSGAASDFYGIMPYPILTGANTSTSTATTKLGEAALAGSTFVFVVNGGNSTFAEVTYVLSGLTAGVTNVEMKFGMNGIPAGNWHVVGAGIMLEAL